FLDCCERLVRVGETRAADVRSQDASWDLDDPIRSLIAKRAEDPYCQEALLNCDSLVRRRHVQRKPVRVDRRANSGLVDLLRHGPDERVELRARVRDPQRHRAAHLVAAQVADGTPDERALTAAAEGLANHSVASELRVDIRSSDCPAAGLPPNDDAARQLRT